MLKFERTDKKVRVETNGNLLEIMADITLLLKVVYEHLEKTTKKSSGVGWFSASRRAKSADGSRCQRFDQASGRAERNGSR